MPSPLAHVGLAWAFHAAFRPLLPWTARDAALVAFVAVAADLDVVVDLLRGDGISFHHGPTHSVFFALLLGAGVWRLAPRCGPSALFAALLHAPLDWTTGDVGAPARYGVTFLWPVSGERFIAARPFFPPYHIDAGGGLWNMLAREALPAYARELAVVVPVAVLAMGIRALRIRTRGP